MMRLSLIWCEWFKDSYKGWFGRWETNLHSWRPKWKEVTFKEPILHFSEIKIIISFFEIKSEFHCCFSKQIFWGLSQFEMFVSIWWSYLWLLFQYEESVFIISKFLSISAVSKNLSPTSMFPFWGFLRKAYVTYLLSQIENVYILWWPISSVFVQCYVIMYF